MKYSVAIVDDHVLIAKALTAIVNKFNDFTVLYEVYNGKELIRKFDQPENIPDLVLLDINMPIMDGFETASWLTENQPGVKILSLSVQDHENSLVRMIRCGARGYLLKNVKPSELEIALLAVMEKGYYYTDWMAHKMIHTLVHPDTNNHDISERELEFLNYAATEMTYKEIADKMCCSPRTVEGYRDSLFEKFSLKTRVSLVVYALKHRIINLE